MDHPTLVGHPKLLFLSWSSFQKILTQAWMSLVLALISRAAVSSSTRSRQLRIYSTDNVLVMCRSGATSTPREAQGLTAFLGCYSNSVDLNEPFKVTVFIMCVVVRELKSWNLDLNQQHWSEILTLPPPVLLRQPFFLSSHNTCVWPKRDYL